MNEDAEIRHAVTLPPLYEFRDMLRAAGVKRDCESMVFNIVHTCALQGESIGNAISRWRRLRPEWFI